MADKKKPKSKSSLTVSMSRENLYRLKEAAIKERVKLREYVHHALGLPLEEATKK